MLFTPWIIRLLSAVLLTCLMPLNISAGSSRAVPSETFPVKPTTDPAHAESVILFVLEGIGEDSPKVGPMPVLNRLVKAGAVPDRQGVT